MQISISISSYSYLLVDGPPHSLQLTSRNLWRRRPTEKIPMRTITGTVRVTFTQRY